MVFWFICFLNLAFLRRFIGSFWLMLEGSGHVCGLLFLELNDSVNSFFVGPVRRMIAHS